MPFCMQCGFKLMESDNFCMACGAPVQGRSGQEGANWKARSMQPSGSQSDARMQSGELHPRTERASTFFPTTERPFDMNETTKS